MYFNKFSSPSLSIHSYLLGDEKTKKCVVIDPTRQVIPYILDAQNHGLEITDILETHVHADFVSGAVELKNELNGKPTIHCSGMGGKKWIPFYADKVVVHDDEIKIGSIKLKAMHTPGHTPEHLSWVCYDETRSEDPWFIFTGDCLFVGSVGRPDLLGPGEREVLSKQLYQSLFERLSKLPDFVEVWPSHGAGSLCGKNLNSVGTSTIGYEKRNNAFFKDQPWDAWKKEILKDLPSAPPYFSKLKKKNVQGPALLKDLKTEHWNASAPKKTGIWAWCKRQFLRLLGYKDIDSLFLIDTRLPELYAAAFIKNSINIPLNPSFSHWAGWMVPFDKPLGIIVENPIGTQQAVDSLRLMGFDQPIKIIEFKDIQNRFPELISSFPLIDPAQLHQKQNAKEKLTVVDVRTNAEWNEGHIPGAHHIELNDLPNRISQLDRQETTVLVCKSGARASLASSLLKNHGFPVMNLKGGMQAWNQAKLEVARPSRPVV